ncbi:MAG TPA: hypothetical protein VF142_05240 [Longimicrobium sp.]
MDAIRVLKHIDSDPVHIPELREMMGQDVQITVRPQGAAVDAEPLETLETFLGDAAHRPPPTAEETAELRAAAATDPILASALDFAESVRIDADAIVRLRANSGT